MIVYSKPSKKEISQRKLETYDKYCKLIQWGRSDPVAFCSRILGIELLDIQKYAIYNSWYRDFVLWLESRNAGKALALDTKLPTPTGYTTMGEVKVGDYLLDVDGKPTKVIYTSEIFLGNKCYEIEFEDGEKIIADADHLWYVHVKSSSVLNNNDYIIVPTYKIAKDYKIKENDFKYSVPIVKSKKNKNIISVKLVSSVPTKCIQVDNPRQLYLCGEKNTVTHNTTKLAVYTMLRSLLIPYHVTYFIGNSGDQAKEVFKKMEKIAKKEIESFVGSTDVFLNELKINGTNSDGFTHNPASFKCELFNSSEIYTLNSDIINIKGKRAGLVCYDEAGWFNDELFIQTEQFVNQDENFKLGAGIDVSLEPKGFPRQLLYASSASDTDSGFYKKYRQFCERMIIGDSKYFVCDFNVDVVMNATYNGDPYPPLISKDKVDKAMEENREKALRELYNKFSADSHEGQILIRRDIMQYTVRRPPLLCNDTGNRLFIIAWDSARLNDNSVIGVAELRQDEEKGWCMDVHNVVSLVDVLSKKKTPMRMPEQVKRFQDLLLDYNGSDKQKLDYENIKAVICDSGSGGQIIGGVSDYLLGNWIGKDGKEHKGIIDRFHKANETAKYKFPDAVDIMKLVDPKANRNDIFDAAEKMVKLGVVTFPADYEGKDYILTIDDEGNEHIHNLTLEEQEALIQIDLMKTEIVTMCKYVNAGNVTYNFPPDKRHKMHDDRVFVFGLLCWYLAQLRRGQIINKPTPQIDYSNAPRCISTVSF